ncbi:EEF1A lysine methyltransferase 2-like [Portunus trituberculatus]|uniref:EEF1A lysine methyltransferase 2-like n=1 Tax=Portunus trituberculatus TaxID=210409 RepID=UPI001E1CF79D|nr:EEF1A lysine methyltransferase 2-like [Portunus trituberculatus]
MELPSSQLGTKEYWDAQYERELSNFENHGDIGEIWFEDNVDRLLEWILDTDLITTQSSIIDIGCGNGAFLLNLAAEGFTNLHGIDYSQKAVELAQSIAAQKEMNITYKKVDLVKCSGESLAVEYDVCHDKGTYDAVSLCPDDPSSKRAAYIKAVHCMTRKNGLFIITSCNWTQEELYEHFSDYFIVEHIIPMPTFMFGGKVGSRVSSVVFKKKLQNP